MSRARNAPAYPWPGGLLGAGVLALALVLAQSQGLLHGLVHAGPAHAAQTGDADTPWLLSLFADHDDDADCRLFDQCSHADGLPALHRLVLPLFPPVRSCDAQAPVAPLLAPALRRARGPPAKP